MCYLYTIQSAAGALQRYPLGKGIFFDANMQEKKE